MVEENSSNGVKMAKRSIIARNLKRRRLVAKYETKRRKLKKMLLDPDLKPQEREQIQRAIRRMPRDASRTRVSTRCALTGRSRGCYRKFQLSRIAFREAALRGDLPGVTKSSW